MGIGYPPVGYPWYYPLGRYSAWTYPGTRQVCLYFVFLETRIIGLYIMPLIGLVWIYLRSNFSSGFNSFLFLQDWRFSRSRSSKVIDFGTNWKRVCDFLLVRHSNVGPILHRFGDITGFFCAPEWPHPYSILILGVFPLHQIALVGVNWAGACEIIFEVFQPMWSDHAVTVGLPERYRRTDG